MRWVWIVLIIAVLSSAGVIGLGGAGTPPEERSTPQVIQLPANVDVTVASGVTTYVVLGTGP